MELKNKTKFLLVFGIIFVTFLLFNTNKVSAAEISNYKCKVEKDGYILYNDFYSSNNCIKEDSYGISLYKYIPIDSEINKMIEDTNNKKTEKLLIEVSDNITNATSYTNNGVVQNLEIINLKDKKYVVAEVEYKIGINDTNKITRFGSVNIQLHSSNDTPLGGGEHKYFSINEMLYKTQPKMLIDGWPYDYPYSDIKIDDSITLGEPMLKEKIEGITLSKTIKDGYGKDDINYNVIVNEEIFKKNYEVGYYDKFKDSDGNIVIPVYVEIPNDIVWMAYGTGTHFLTAKIEEINGKNYFKHDVIIRYNSMSFEEDFNIEVMDGQDVCYIFDNGEGEAVVWKRKSNAIVFNRIIVKSETTIKNEDTNIKLNADTNVIPSNTILEATEIKTEKILNIVKESLKEISNKYISYDITLKSDGVAIQPNGKVKISIPIPSNFDKTKLSIFRISDDGTKIKYDTKVENNFATIETDHFSTYVLAENNIVANNEQDNTTTQETTKPTQPTNKGEKDETPKTGTIDIIGYVLATTILAGVGIVALKKNLK